jgi:hypothetical protein
MWILSNEHICAHLSKQTAAIFPQGFFLKRFTPSGRDELLLIRFSCRLDRAWRGAAFYYCRTHRMIAPKIWMVPTSCSRRLPGTSPCVDYRSGVLSCDQTETLQVVSSSGDVRGSRRPTRAESGKLSVPMTPIQPRTVKSGSPAMGWPRRKRYVVRSSALPKNSTGKINS